MPSDVNAKIARVIESYNNLATGGSVQFSDIQALFNNAAELELDFEVAKGVAASLQGLFRSVKDQAEKLVNDSKTEELPKGTAKKLTSGTPKIKSELDKVLRQISNQIVDEVIPRADGSKQTNLSELSNQLDKFPRVGDRPAAIVALSPADSSTDSKRADFANSADTSRSEDEGAVQMQRFFTNVTASLIGAQQELNRQSLDYAARLDQRIPPAYYSIPSLKAEMKVGFSESKTKGMNLILFSSKEQRDNHGESTLSFELVAVPPPPGTTRPELPPGFLLIGDEKEAVLDKIQATAGALLGKALSENFGNTRALTAVLRYAEQAGKKKYLIFWPSQTLKDLENKPDFWRNLLVLHLVEENGQLQADPSVFDPNFLAALDKGKQYLLIPDTAGLHKLKPEELVAYINCFGDAVLKALKIFEEYYRTKA